MLTVSAPEDSIDKETQLLFELSQLRIASEQQLQEMREQLSEALQVPSIDCPASWSDIYHCCGGF
jgi:hypothetical protein